MNTTGRVICGLSVRFEECFAKLDLTEFGPASTRRRVRTTRERVRKYLAAALPWSASGIARTFRAALQYKLCLCLGFPHTICQEDEAAEWNT